MEKLTEEKAFDIVRNALKEIGISKEEEHSLSLKTNLMGDLGFDSLDVVQTCINIESGLNVAIDDRKVEFKKVTIGFLTAEIISIVDDDIALAER